MELVGVDDAGEGKPSDLAACGFGQEVVILGEQHASQFRGPVEDFGIGRPPAAVLLDGEHVDAPQSYPGENRPGTFSSK